jgi:hypothetical protein
MLISTNIQCNVHNSVRVTISISYLYSLLSLSLFRTLFLSLYSFSMRGAPDLGCVALSGATGISRLPYIGSRRAGPSGPVWSCLPLSILAHGKKNQGGIFI